MEVDSVTNELPFHTIGAAIVGQDQLTEPGRLEEVRELALRPEHELRVILLQRYQAIPVFHRRHNLAEKQVVDLLIGG